MMRCANCGNEISKISVFTHAGDMSKSSCQSCGFDMVDRNKYESWKRLFVGILFVVSIPSIFFMGRISALLLYAAITLVAYLSFPFREKAKNGEKA